MEMLPEIMKYMTALGAAGGPIFAILYVFERVDRKKAESDNRALAREVTGAMVGVDRTLGNVVNILGARRAV